MKNDDMVWIYNNDEGMIEDLAEELFDMNTALGLVWRYAAANTKEHYIDMAKAAISLVRSYDA